MSATAAAVDGRRARRERGRRAVLDAVVDLLHEGRVPMTAAMVSQRSGVSPATIFRYFETLDDLQHEATARYLERNASLFELPGIGEGPLAERAERFARARTRLYASIEPVARLGRARSFDHPHLAASLHEVRTRLADQVAVHFEPELRRLTPAARGDVVALVSTLTSFESWDQQRSDLGRSPAQIRRSWRRAVEDLCASA